MFGLRDVLAAEIGIAGMTWVSHWKATLQASRVRSSSWHAHGMFLSHALNTDEIGRTQTNWVFLPKAIRAISPSHFSPSVIVSDWKGSTERPGGIVGLGGCAAESKACASSVREARTRARILRLGPAWRTWYVAHAGRCERFRQRRHDRRVAALGASAIATGTAEPSR